MNLNIFRNFGKKNNINQSQPRNKGHIKEFMAKLSRGLMLPIAMLPIAGLFLGIGNAIFSHAAENSGLWVFGNVIGFPGKVIFSCLPVLFAIAIAITFTKDSGTAGLSALVGWIVFCGTQSAFIITHKGDVPDDNTYNFLFYAFDSTQYKAIFTDNVGIASLSTSVFGGIIIGFVVATLYNRFKNIQLPSMIGFFSGIRFIPIITFVASILLGLLFSIAWPIIGLGLYFLGKVLGGTPLRLNSFFFGYIERSLVPFGLHHAFYAPLWYTQAGGFINLDQPVYLMIDGKMMHMENLDHWNSLATFKESSSSGDQTIWMQLDILAGKVITVTDGTNNVSVKLTFDIISKAVDMHGKLAFQGVNPGQYMQGKYSFMMFALPAAAIAMILIVPKGENRKQAFAIIGSSAATSFLTGITEPLEFTFLFLAPWLFWGFHAFFAGVSFWLMNSFGAHMGMTFSGGVIDFVIYGIIPDALGGGTNCWLAVVIGLCLAPIYFFGFTYLIKKFNIKTPGREGNEIKLFTKADYQAKISGEQVTNVTTQTPVVAQDSLPMRIIAAYGGKENIKNVDACITKLRVQVVDPKLVNRQTLKDLGAHGVIDPSPQSVYAVFGTKADLLKNQINEILNSN